MGIKDDFYKEFKDGMRESRKSGNLKKIKEDYGWEVSYDNIWNLYDDMKEYFGDEELLESIVRAMGTYDLGDILTYICRMNDYNSQYLEGHEEDEEEELDESKKSRMNEDKTFVNYIAVYRDKDECLGYIQNDTPHLTQDVEKAKKFSNEEDARQFASMLRKKGIYDDENEGLYVEGLYESKMKEYSSSGTIKNYKHQNNFTKTKKYIDKSASVGDIVKIVGIKYANSALPAKRGLLGLKFDFSNRPEFKDYKKNGLEQEFLDFKNALG